jgi:hypothetical protein
MARPAHRSNPVVVVLILAVVAAIGAYAWLHRHAATETKASQPIEALHVPAGRIDPANEGRLVTIEGPLNVGKPARDTQLGIGADAVMLLRFAEMLQWQEKCDGGKCTYLEVWSPDVIDSRRFRETAGHVNPERLPIASARFSAGELRLGAFAVDAAMLGNYRLDSALQTKPVAFPVTTKSLPSNLAISFREVDGALYAGDPKRRAVGDLRISYRIIPAGSVELTGVQRGEKLLVQKSKPKP